jgi:hypothetical protein
MKTKRCCDNNCFNEAIGYYKVNGCGVWLCRKHARGELKNTIYRVRGNPDYAYLHDMETDAIGFNQIPKYSNTRKEFIDIYGEKKINVMDIKAKKFIEYGCLDYSKESKTFFVKPLKGYNSTTYTLTQKNGD